MESIQTTAIRVCGAATCVLILVACATFASITLGAESVPSLRLAGGASLLVALTGFIVANVSSPATAGTVSAISAVVIAGCAVLRIYMMLAPRAGSALMNFNLVDGLLTIAVFALLIPMYRSVWNRTRNALPA